MCRYDATPLERTLSGLLPQARDHDAEVVVVDSSTTGEGSRIAKGVLHGLGDRLRIVREPRGLGPGAARNVGVAASAGDPVTFLAADCIPDPEWLARRLRWHRDGFDVVVGAVGCARPYSISALTQWLTCFSGGLPGSRVRYDRFPFFGWSYARSSLDEPFREDLPASEDREFNERLLARGPKVVFDPSIVVRHIGLNSMAALVKHQHHHGDAAARLAEDPRTHRYVRRYPKALLPLWYPIGKWARALPSVSAAGSEAVLAYVALLPWALRSHAAWARGYSARSGTRTSISVLRT